MIRWFLGFFLVVGSVGGLEQNTMSISETMAFAAMGLALMGWATYDFNIKYGEDV
tara:strand:- start:1533 stop:1697 length:165 start_codon:yes stop_codon:yes gene_type:complete